MITLNRSILVLSENSQNRILDILHDGHFNFQRTINQAKNQIFWPNINKDIKEKWQKCLICQQNIRSKLAPKTNNFSQNKTTQINPLNLEPMSIISIDWCHILGKNYLITVDHSSGFIWAKQSLHKNTKTCLKILKTLFATVGFPVIVQSDNSGEFRQSFTQNLKLLGIKHSTLTSWPQPDIQKEYPYINNHTNQLIGKKINQSSMDIKTMPHK